MGAHLVAHLGQPVIQILDPGLCPIRFLAGCCQFPGGLLGLDPGLCALVARLLQLLLSLLEGGTGRIHLRLQGLGLLLEGLHLHQGLIPARSQRQVAGCWSGSAYSTNLVIEVA